MGLLTHASQRNREFNSAMRADPRASGAWFHQTHAPGGPLWVLGPSIWEPFRSEGGIGDVASCADQKDPRASRLHARGSTNARYVNP